MKPMKLFIIQPSHYRSQSNLTIHKTRKRSLVGLTLPYLAALTPRDWEVTVIDEQLMDIDFEAPVDLVALTTWTINSFRAYEIADQFRDRGIPVIIGGPHTYFYSEEVAEHCDAVGIGEGEDVWPKMLEDAASGRLEKVYRAQTLQGLDNLPFPRYELLDFRKFGLFRTFSVQSSRGCPFHCEFCSERFYLGQGYRFRPVDEVVEEIKFTGAKSVFFADSMFAGNKAHTMELMEALIPLRIRWSALWSSYLCTDQGFMDLAKRSGLLHVNIGIESIDGDTLVGMKKKVNKVKQYKEILHSLRKRGMSYSLNFIFGWDTENMGVFDATLTFLRENKVPVAYFYILNPHRGTPLYDRMEREDRLLDIQNMRRWPGNICYIKPTYCSPQELEDNVKRMYNEFYRFPSILARLAFPVTKANITSWILNLSQRKMARWDNQVQNFDHY
jgi:radical SAM superfamily enzyme YgiQ (UPF0313 family)